MSICVGPGEIAHLRYCVEKRVNLENTMHLFWPRTEEKHHNDVFSFEVHVKSVAGREGCGRSGDRSEVEHEGNKAFRQLANVSGKVHAAKVPLDDLGSLFVGFCAGQAVLADIRKQFFDSHQKLLKL